MGSGSIVTLWDNLRTSLWFVPGLCVSVAIMLSFALPEVDRQLEARDVDVPARVFEGSSDGARSILSTVAGSLITIIGVVFSITIVVLQQASSQFTPRIIGNFIRHTGTQLTLGVYLATFLYSVLVLRYVRGEDAQAAEFLPQLSIAVSLVLAAICLGFLVYFVHHMATSIQASMVIASVNTEFREDIARLYPEHVGDRAQEVDQPLADFRTRYLREPVTTIRIKGSGFLRSVDPESMTRELEGCRALAVLPQIGEFLTEGVPVVELSADKHLSDEECNRIRSCFILGEERTRYQDPLFSIRQLVDIALKALSPGINDPTTANNALSMIAASLAELAGRQIPDQIRSTETEHDGETGQIYVWANRPSFANYVDNSFSEIRRTSQANVAVTLHLVDSIRSLGRVIPNSTRATPLHHQLDEVLFALPEQGFSSSDERRIEDHIAEARAALPPAASDTPSF